MFFLNSGPLLRVASWAKGRKFIIGSLSLLGHKSFFPQPSSRLGHPWVENTIIFQVQIFRLLSCVFSLAGWQ